MSITITAQTRTVYVEKAIDIIQCAGCGIDFGIGQDFERRRREDHGTFYCPNGHSNVYDHETEAENLRFQNERLRAQAKTARENEQFHRERAAHERRSAAAVRGHLTRLRNRISNGVCPCCQRSFENVRNHIKGQHPAFAETHPDALEPS